MVIDSVVFVFVEAIGGASNYYALFAVYFVVSTGAVFYKISTL